MLTGSLNPGCEPRSLRGPLPGHANPWSITSPFLFFVLKTSRCVPSSSCPFSVLKGATKRVTHLSQQILQALFLSVRSFYLASAMWVIMAAAPVESPFLHTRKVLGPILQRPTPAVDSPFVSWVRFHLQTESFPPLEGRRDLLFSS